MSHDTLRRLVSDAYNTQSAGMTVGLPRVNVDASQLQSLLKHHDALKAEADRLRAEVERMMAERENWVDNAERMMAVVERDTIEKCAEVCLAQRNMRVERRPPRFKVTVDMANIMAEKCAAAIRAMKGEKE